MFHCNYQPNSHNLLTPSSTLTIRRVNSPVTIVLLYNLINPFGTIGLTTAIFVLFDSPVVLVELFYMGQPP